MTNHEKLKEFVKTASDYDTDADVIMGFLKQEPELLCGILPKLTTWVANRCVLFEHKANVKDEYLEMIKTWVAGEMHIDKQFHPELRDKMIENINNALKI